VIVVEHDEDAIMSADHVIDIGPGAGVHGGEIIAAGTPIADHAEQGVTDGTIPGRYPADQDTGKPDATQSIARCSASRAPAAII
jgi:excinuclease UvrABC ATPase subunit